MKKTAVFILALLLLCIPLLCACSAQKPDPKAIVGSWEYWDQVWCEFNKDGTCIVGGTTGAYSVSDDMVLTMTPTDGSPQDFLWAEKKEKVTTNNWFIEDGTLYLNGGVYQWTEPETQAATQTATKTATQATASATQSTAGAS